MRDDRRFGAEWVAAWRMLTDFPLPKALERYDEAPVSGARMLSVLPLLGALCGALVAVAGWLVAVLSNRFAGAAVFAMLAVFFMIGKDSGRALTLLVSWILNLTEREGFASAVAAASSDRDEVYGRRFSAAVAAALAWSSLLMLYVVGLYGCKWFLIPLFAAEFATQGEFASELAPEAGGVEDPGRTGRRIMWIVCGVIALVMLPFIPTATAFGILVVCLTNLTFRDYLLRVIPDFQADTVTWVGGATEAALLCCAFLWTI